MIEEHIKARLTEKNIALKDIAEVLSYNTNSLYNKFSKHNLSLHDIIFLSEILDEQVTFTDKETNLTYTIDCKEYLSGDEMQRLAEFKAAREKEKIAYENWCVAKSSQFEFYYHYFLSNNSQSPTENFSCIESYNFLNMVYITGDNHDAAAEWLEQSNIESNPDNEVSNCYSCEKRFNVRIWFQPTT